MKTVYKWFERFRNGCESVEDEESSGRPSTSKTQLNVETVSEMIRSNRRLTIREISEDLNIFYGSVQNILTTDLNKRRVSAKFVPRVLTVEQKQQLLSISLELRDRAASDSSFLGNVIREMKLGSMVMILRPRFRVFNATHPVLLVRKKRVNQDPKSR